MHFTRQLRHVLRKLARTPGFTAVAILTLAIGIGATTAIFSVVNGILLKPLPYDTPEELVGIWHSAPGLGFPDVNQSPALYFTYREDGQTFAESGMWRNESFTVTGLAEPEQVTGVRITDGVLPLLRASTALGRIFTADDDTPGAPETVILGHGYWQRRFGGDPGVVGRTLRVDGVTREIIGVMPEGFRFLGADPTLYVTYQLDRPEGVNNFSHRGIGRLKPGATLDAANADVGRMLQIAVERYPNGITPAMLEQARFGPQVRPLMEDVVGDIGKVLWVLLGTVGVILLLACANVANLFLVRAEGRQREVAVRTAMGASWGNVARQFFTESVVLGLLAGTVGIALAYGGIRLLVAIGPEELPRLHAISLDPIVLLFALGVSTFAGLLFGLFPVLSYGRSQLVSSLKEAGRGGSAGRDKHRVRNTLAGAEVALALLLMIGSGLMLRSFQALRDVRPGFERPDEIYTARVLIPEAEVDDPTQVIQTYERVLELVAGLPGVTSAGYSSSITMDGWDSNDPVYVEGHDVPEGQLPPIRRFKWIAGAYHATMGNSLLAGRPISWTDVRAGAPVVMVTKNFAEEYFGSPAAAIGKRIRQEPSRPWREIVGVVGDVYDDGVQEEATPVVYWPAKIQQFWSNELFVHRGLALAVRTTRANPSSLLREIEQLVWSVNPNLPLAQSRTVREILDERLARTSFALVMIGIAAAVAILLGSIGIYGVISYVVAQRTQEIGVRMALGAAGGHVRRLVFRQGAWVTGVGIIAGLAGAVAATRGMSALLFGVSPVDILTYGAAALTVAAVAMLAVWIPAHRAASVDPMVAIRYE